MNEIKVVIPALTFVKMFLRGVTDLSFIREVKKQTPKMKLNKRVGIKTPDGIATYFEKISDNEVILLTAYHIGKEEESVSKRAEALMGILVQKLQ